MLLSRLTKNSEFGIILRTEMNGNGGATWARVIL